MSKSIDMNADLGEGFPNDARLLDLVTSAGVSCGAHAGDRRTILATLSAAKVRGVAVGAHPGYPDRDRFGRAEQAATAEDVERLIVEQVEALRVLAGEAGVRLRFVKPHGALYNQSQREEAHARGVVAAAGRLGLPVLGQPGSRLSRLAGDAKVRFVAEGFPDRRYTLDGRLVPRDRPDALLHEPAEVEAQVVRFVNEGIATLCIHGDDPRAVANAEKVRAVLVRQGIAPRFWAE